MSCCCFFAFSKFLIIKVACTYFRKFGERKANWKKKKTKNTPDINPTKLEETSLLFWLIFFQSLFQSFKRTGIIVYEVCSLGRFFFNINIFLCHQSKKKQLKKKVFSVNKIVHITVLQMGHNLLSHFLKAIPLIVSNFIIHNTELKV